MIEITLFPALLMMAVITTLAFVAYNYPKQYFWFVMLFAVLLIAGKIYLAGMSAGKDEAIAAVQASKLASTMQAAVTETISNYEAPLPKWAQAEWLGYAWQAFFYYVFGLGLLPVIGMTADKRGRSEDNPASL